MRSLLDINVLIALHDPDHIHNERALEWWASNGSDGWASCPISENGFVRITSSLRYHDSFSFSVGDCIEMLNAFKLGSNHEFWPDDVSLCDDLVFIQDSIHGPRQLTDLYLLAIASRNGGRLVTFDQGISIASVVDAVDNNLCVIRADD
ncbi:MAG TPA: hypothetical protein PKA82_01850 [Pyrinomonadaceae bacterium]|nr:hypothetical protein [Pyrinomonadaceae bacterium]